MLAQSEDQLAWSVGCGSVKLVAGFLTTDQRIVPYQSFPDSPAILEASVGYALDGVLLNGASGASPEVLLEASLIQRT